MIVNMHMELGRTITIERTEPDFPIGDATTKFENELKSMHAAGDGKEVFCNGNWEGDFKEIKRFKDFSSIVEQGFDVLCIVLELK